MSIDYTAWLKSNSAIRCILIDANAHNGSTETPVYISSKHYYDAVNGIAYDASLKALTPIAESMGEIGSPSFTACDLVFDLRATPHKTAKSWTWKNRAVTVYWGDVSWAKADFIPILTGYVEDKGRSGYGELALKLRDKTQGLNCPAFEDKLGGTTANKNEFLPYLVGECFNFVPLLTAPSTQTYMIGNSAIERVIDVRESGLPLTVTPNLSNGTFTLANTPKGQITCSAQGYKSGTYAPTIANTIKQLVKTAGKSATRFTDADIDLANFTAFDAANPQTIGYYITQRDNLLGIINALAGSIGANVLPGRNGKIRLYQIGNASGTSTRVVNDADMMPGTLKALSVVDKPASVVLNYNKNWSVQTDLKTAIPPEHAALFAEEWDKVTSTDGARKTLYKETAEPQAIDTYLVNEAEAQAEADRRRDIGGTWYEFEGLPSAMDLNLGDDFLLQSAAATLPELVSGKRVVVRALSLDLMNARVTVTVFG
jgi:hypothetical protein